MDESFKNLKAAEAIPLIKDLTDAELKHVIEGDYKRAVIAEAKREAKKRQEIARINSLYDYEEQIAAKPGSVILGLDEVGRGPLAGPLTVGGVILDRDNKILCLNDSKKLSAEKRCELASQIKDCAVAATTFSVPPSYIDKHGMTECLKRAFSAIVAQIEKDIHVDVILLDGNPLYFDSREVNIIKGDAKCASISAASIVAKVERDAYMTKMNNKYPQYHFDKNKGYGTKDHIDAIKNFGISPIHRKSFCTSFLQETLF